MNQVKNRTDIRFENRMPDKVNSRLTVKNKVKQVIVSLSLFVTILLFGLLIGAKYDSYSQNSSISSLGVSIISWSLFLYGFLNIFVYFISPVKFEITWLRFAIHTLSSIIFSAMILLLKFDVLGDFNHSNAHSNEATFAIWLYVIIDASISGLIIFYLLVISILNRRQYLMQFKKTIVGTITLIPLVISPFLIEEYDKLFKLGKELWFLIVALTSISLFITTLIFFGLIESYEASKLKNINKFLGATTMVITLAALLGIVIHQVIEVGIKFQTLTIVSLSLAFVSFVLVNTFLLFFKSDKSNNLRQNSLVNKLTIKGYIIFNLVFSLILIFLVPKVESKATYDYSVMIISTPIILIALTLLILQLNNVIVFVRWEVLSIIANLLLAFVFIFMQGIMFVIPDKDITLKWLGRGILFLILGIYLITELSILTAELGSVFIGKNSSSKNKKNEKIKNKGNM